MIFHGITLMKQEKPKTKPFKIIDDLYDDVKIIVKKVGRDVESIGKSLRVKKEKK